MGEGLQARREDAPRPRGAYLPLRNAATAALNLSPMAWWSAASMRWLPPGTLCASREFDIHEVANTQPQASLVTLHVYSPPLRDVNLYRCAETASAS